MRTMILIILVGSIPLWDVEHGEVRRVIIGKQSSEVDVRAGDRVCYEDGYCADVEGE